MSHQAKIFARVFDFAGGSEPSTMKLTLEWRQLVSPFAKGKLSYETATLVSNESLEDELKLAVARHINSIQVDAGYRPRDVIGCGV